MRKIRGLVVRTFNRKDFVADVDVRAGALAATFWAEFDVD